MIGQRRAVTVLSARLIPGAARELCEKFGFPPSVCSLALLSTDCDDATYIALDEATKKAAVEVVYTHSLYAGAANASTALAGEVIGILGAENPSEAKSGLAAALAALEQLGFRTADEAGSVVYLAHCVPRTGSFLSGLAHIPAGQALAYLIATPVEAVVGLDAALKAAEVRLTELYRPPTETNFAGGLLTGTQSACRAACDAFAQAVCAVAASPREAGFRA